MSENIQNKKASLCIFMSTQRSLALRSVVLDHRGSIVLEPRQSLSSSLTVTAGLSFRFPPLGLNILYGHSHLLIISMLAPISHQSALLKSDIKSLRHPGIQAGVDTRHSRILPSVVSSSPNHDTCRKRHHTATATLPLTIPVLPHERSE